MQYMVMAKTDAVMRPALEAAICMIVAATIPPVRGGRPAMIRVRSIKSEPT